MGGPAVGLTIGKSNVRFSVNASLTFGGIEDDYYALGIIPFENTEIVDADYIDLPTSFDRATYAKLSVMGHIAGCFTVVF